jgi:hypothetical protein
MPLKVTNVNETVRTYDNAVRFEVDGHGDYIFFDENNNMVATRKRSTVHEIEVIYNG